MTEDSRTLEQRMEAMVALMSEWAVDPSRGGPREMLAAGLEAAGLPDLLVERDAALERAERAEAGIDDEVEALRVAWMVAKRDLTTAEAERDAAQAAAEEMREALESDEPALCPLVRAERAEAAAREMAKAMQTAIDAMPDFYWSEASVRGIVECVVAMKRILAAHPGFLEEGS